MKKFSKLFAVLALTLVALFSFAACGGTSVVGDWTLEEFTSSTAGIEVDMKEMGMDVSVSLKDDNTFSMTLSMAGIPELGGTASSETVTGTYEFKDNKLTFKTEGDDVGDISDTVLYLEYKDGKLVYDTNTTDNGVAVKARLVLKRK